MFGILVSAFNSVLSYLLRTVVIKFAVFSALFLVVKELMGAITDLLPKSSNLQSLFDALPDASWYFLNLFQVPFGISLVISALFTRFIIRRLPVIG
ncbi:DUF2523 domain-containing protein [Escherichia coli]